MFTTECPNSGRARRSLLALIAVAGLLFAGACSNPEKAKLEHVQSGETYLKEEKFQEASIEFRNAIQLDDRLAAAHWGLAQAYEGLGSFQQVYAELRRTIELDPNQFDARARLGNYYLLAYQASKKNELLTEADKLAEEILARDGKYIEGHVLKAGILFARGEKDKALAKINEAIALDPNRLETHLGLARFYQNVGDAAKAEEAYKRAISINDRSALAYNEYGKFLVQQNRPAEAEATLKRAVEVDPQSRAARLTLASFYFVSKQLDKAEGAYQSLAELDRGKPEGRAVLADYYQTVGRYDDAVKIYQEVAAAAPEYMRARYRLTELMLQRGDVTGAAAQVEEVLSKNNADMQALLLRSRIRMQQDDAKNAIEDLKQVLKQESTSQLGLYYMTEAQMRVGQADQARIFGGELEKNHPDFLPGRLIQAQIGLLAGDKANLENAKRIADELIARLDKTAPDRQTSPQLSAEMRAKALTTRGAVQVQLKNVAAARADFTAARDIEPNSPASYVNLAGVALAEGKGEEAVQQYERALQIDNANFDALRGLIDVYVGLKQFDQAHSRIDQAIGARPNSAGLHYLKSHIYGFQRNAEAAEASLKRTLEIDPTYSLATRTLGTLYLNTNQPERAIEEYRKLIEKRPNEDAASYWMIGMIQDGRQEYDKAVEAYKQALAIDPNFDFAANNLAWNYAEHGKGNLDEAIRLAQGVVQRNPDTPGYADTLGWVYYKKGLYPAAIAQLQKAVDKTVAKGGDSAAYRYHLGLAQAATGRKAEAQKQLERALSMPKNGLSPQQAEEARKALSTL